MHTCWFVIHQPISAPALQFRDVRAAVIRGAMHPFHDDRAPSGSNWDWYQIGARFTGALDGYSPEDDPEQRHLWPTERKERREDTQPITAWPLAAQPYYVLFPEGRLIDVHDLGGEFWSTWHAHALKEWAGCAVTVVDCHS